MWLILYASDLKPILHKKLPPPNPFPFKFTNRPNLFCALSKQTHPSSYIQSNNQISFAEHIIMNSSQQATLAQAIKLLQSLLTGTSDSAGPIDVPIPEYDAQVEKFYQSAQTLQPQIQKLTQIFKTASTSMKRILSFSHVYKKFTPPQQEKLKNIFITLSNDIEPIKKNPNFIDHSNAIKEILSATFWVFVPTPEFIIKGAVEGADYNALKFQKKKVKEHNDWWALVSGACKLLQKFVAKSYPMGLNFNPKGEDKWDTLLSGSSGESSKPVQQQKSVPEQKAKQPEVQKPKVPKKQLVGLNWQIRHHENQQIKLAEEVQMKHGLFIENCSNCQVIIDSKCKSVSLNKCENIKLTVKSCVSGVEVMNCKSVTVMIKEKTPSVSVDKCDKVTLLLNENNIDTDIVSCRANELNVSVEKTTGEDSKMHLISDQLITKWNGGTKKFETKIYDKFL